jgi:hypothetical protein
LNPHAFNLTGQLESKPLEFPTLAATDLMRLGLIEFHENSHLTKVILKKISISLKLMR